MMLVKIMKKASTSQRYIGKTYHKGCIANWQPGKLCLAEDWTFSRKPTGGMISLNFIRKNGCAGRVRLPM